MENKKFKLISFDLDGTLLNNRMLLEDSTKSGLKKIIENGYICVINSSRSLFDILDIIDKIKFDYISALNGAIIYNNNNLQIEFINPINKDVLNKIIKLVIDNNISANFFSIDQAYLSCYSKKSINKKYQKSLNPKYLKHFSNDIDILSIELILRSNDEVLSIRNQLGDFINNLNIENSSDYYIEITSKNVNKGIALEFIANKLDVLLEETIAIGDSLTDISVFKESGLSIAMKNSEKEVIKNAKLTTTKDNNQNGAIDFILNEFNLLKK